MNAIRQSSMRRTRSRLCKLPGPAGLSLAMFLIGAIALLFFVWAVREGVNAKAFFTSAGFFCNVLAVLLFPLRWRVSPGPELPGTGCATSLRGMLSIVCLLLAVWSYCGWDGFFFSGERPCWRAGRFLLLGSVFLPGAAFLFTRWRQEIARG